MEIGYTNFELDSDIFGKNEITALIDTNGTFLYDKIYDIKSFAPESRLPLIVYLRFNTNFKKWKLLDELLEDLEIPKELMVRPLSKLSSSELQKVLIIKLCISNAKNIIIESIDTYFNFKDITLILKTLKMKLDRIGKNVLVTANNPDNLVQYVHRYIVAKDGNISYIGKDFTKMGVPTSIRTFIDLANNRGAKLNDYKEPNDLLKAIYRSVK